MAVVVEIEQGLVDSEDLNESFDSEVSFGQAAECRRGSPGRGGAVGRS